jgi:hypothetical protein
MEKVVVDSQKLAVLHLGSWESSKQYKLVIRGPGFGEIFGQTT